MWAPTPGPAHAQWVVAVAVWLEGGEPLQGLEQGGSEGGSPGVSPMLGLLCGVEKQHLPAARPLGGWRVGEGCGPGLRAGCEGRAAQQA